MSDDTDDPVRDVLLAIHERRAAGDIDDDQADAAVARLRAAIDDPEALAELLREQGEEQGEEQGGNGVETGGEQDFVDDTVNLFTTPPKRLFAEAFAEWEEDRHPRDKGKFASKAGAGAEDKGESKESKKEPAGTSGPVSSNVKGPNPALSNATRPDLDSAQQTAVKGYTASGYLYLNSALRGERPIDRAMTKQRQLLSAAIRKAKPLAEPVAVHRVLDLRPDRLAPFLARLEQAKTAGTPLVFDGFCSTTTKPVAASGAGYMGGNVVLLIEARHGLDVKPYAAIPNEDEMLLDHQSHFEVKGVTQHGNVHHVNLVQIPSPSREEEPVAEEKPGGLLARLKSLFFSEIPTDDHNRFVDNDDSHIHTFATEQEYETWLARKNEQVRAVDTGDDQE